MLFRSGLGHLHRHKFSRLVQMAEAYRCGIVYCATRKMAERVAAMLAGDGFRPILYHGAMSDGERTAAQERFTAEASPLVVATNAFGMGVDRGDIRFVAHWDIPGSLEAYYQEVGRAGRDGASAWCELLFNYADVATQRFFLDGANPAFGDILAVWEAVRRACAKEAATCSVEEWAKLAGVKNDMEVRTILGLIERAGLIEREIMPGNRAYTTRLLPEPDPELKELKRLAAGLDEKRRMDERKLETLLRFVDHPGCRHAYLLNYFGEASREPACSACDRCRRRSPEKRVPPDEAQWIVIQKALSCVVRMKGRFGALRVAQVLHGDLDDTVARHGLDALSTFGLLADMPVPQIRAVLDALQMEGCLAVSPDEYRLVSISALGRQVMLRQREGFLIAWPAEKVRSRRSEVGGRRSEVGGRRSDVGCRRSEGVGWTSQLPAGGPTSVSAASLPPAAALPGAEPDRAAEARLQKWVRKTAAVRGVEPFRILSRQTVAAIAAARPATFAELEAVKGMGPVKVQQYGRMILDTLQADG